MDDNMLERLQEEIKLCFFTLKLEQEQEEEYKNNINYLAAKELITTYNKLVKLYYREEYQKEFLLKSVEQEYKKYLENN